MTTFFQQTEIGFTAEQSPGAYLDYGLDWSDWLANSPGDKITSSIWTPITPGIDLSPSAHTDTSTTVWVKLSAGAEAGAWYEVQNSVVSESGRRDSRVCLIYVKPLPAVGSALFPSRIVAVAKLRRDRLVMLANSIMPDLKLSDDFLWEKLRSAEAEIAHQLRVPLAPTHFFPMEPTPDQIAALAGKPWAVDPPYDYNPADWYGDKWGYIVTRQKPIQSIVGIKFVYPSPAQTIVDVPSDWIRADRRFGHIQVVPTGTAYQTLLGGLFMSHLSGGKTLPFTVHLEYEAGLSNVAADYPDLIDAVQKLAVTKIVEDGFMPQSGSISADGLSQSVSVDVSKYHEAVDRVLNGADGNGGLVARIHGVRVMVM